MRTPLNALLIGSLAIGSITLADDVAEPALADQLTQIIKEYYPDAEITPGVDSLSAKHGTMLFTVHRESRTGEVLPTTREVEGPNFTGFMLSVRLTDTPYRGPLLGPQVLRQPYWQTFIDHPALDGERFCWISFSYGSRINPDFRQAILDALPKSRPPGSTAWLEYEYTAGRAYRKFNVTILANGTAEVFVDRHDNKPAFEYKTQFSPAEAAWFRTLLRTTSFANPERYERPVVGGDGGMFFVRAHFDGQELEAKFGRDEAFADLSREINRLVRQAEVMQRLQHDKNAYDVRTALNDKRVLQPHAFVDPLTRYVLEEDHQLDHALVALAQVTTPQQWGGVVAQALEQAKDEPYRDDSKLTRRQLLLNGITGHPFHVSLPQSHSQALIRNYHVQAAIEATKGTRDAEYNLSLFKKNEARLRAPP